MTFSISCFSFELPEVISNKVFSDNIRTVQLYREGWDLSSPVITLNSDQKLAFSFDDLSAEVKNYFYTIYHCDRNWKVSSLSQQEYLDSFTEYPLEDFEFAVVPLVKYVNYFLNFPNENISFKYSGNYAIVVYDKDSPEEPLITWRMYVVEPMVNIDARIRKSMFDKGEANNQEIDFVIDHKNFPIQNPSRDVKVVLMQNSRHDNAITNLIPMFSDGEKLEYDYNEGNCFNGENEFRDFEFRNYKYPSEEVSSITYHRPVYHVTLLTDELRTQQRYTFEEDLNGRYHIETYQSSYPDVEADYMFVHFRLPMENILLGGGVYVFGELTNWQCSKQNEMKWNMEKNQYELTLLLKQGFYNYAYAWKDLTVNEIKTYPFEGSHHETENDYQIFVYYGRVNDRYDRLVGYQKFNSLINRTFSSGRF